MDSTIIDEAIAEKRTLPGALLPVLHAIQDVYAAPEITVA